MFQEQKGAKLTAPGGINPAAGSHLTGTKLIL